MSSPAATVVIAARNAAATIARALASAATTPAVEILLVDDFSSDDTAALAREFGGARVRVIRPPRHHSLGLTRQTALEAVRTPFAVNLDADDELLPDRVERLVEVLETTGADLAADGLELFSGPSGTLIREMPLPSFLREPRAAVRIFERNYLPGVGQIAFRTECARRIGYDPDLHGVEDTDFFLRAVAAGARIAFVPEVGYRMYSYPGSVSRNLALQRQMLARLLRKHAYADVAQLYRAAGYSERVTAWGLCSMAIFREEFDVALGFLASACPPGSDPNAILEPDGPMPVSAGWRHGFTRGTLLALQGRWAEALPSFESATALPVPPSADLLNNWGVALARTGQPAAAREKFTAALAAFPGYLDATLNLAAESPSHLTTHPLRRQPSRHEY